MQTTSIFRVDRLQGWLVLAAIPITVFVYSLRFVSVLDVKLGALSLIVAALGLLGLVGSVSRRSSYAYFPLVCFVTWVLIAQLLNLYPKRLEIIPGVMPWCAALLFVILSFDVFVDLHWRRCAMDVLVATAAIAGVLAIFDSAGFLEFLFPVFDPVVRPVYSVFGNSGLLGGYFAMVLPIVVYRSASGQSEPGAENSTRPFIFHATHLVAMASIAFGLLLSESRAAWLGAIVGSLIVLSMRGVKVKRVLVLGLAAPLVLLFSIIFAPTGTGTRAENLILRKGNSAQLRWWFWDGAIRMIRDHWVVGVGPGNFEYWSSQYLGEALWAEGGENLAHNEISTEHAHSEPVNLLAETGIVGVAFLLWMLATIVRRPGMEWGGLAALAVFALFHPTLRSPPHLVAAGVFVSALLARGGDDAGGANVFGAKRLLSFGLCVVVIAQLAVVCAVLAPSYDLRRAMDLHITGQKGQPLFDAYERALRHAMSPALGYEKYGIALMEAGRLDDARRQFEAALSGEDSGGVYLVLGALAHHRGDDAEACRMLDACVWRWPSNRDAWKLMVAVTPAEERDGVVARSRRWVGEALSADGHK